jgi:hypothetical protein
MHGVILYSLGKFIVDLHGRSTWERAQNAAGRAGAVYLPTKIYPDQEAAALVEAIAHTTGRPPLELLEEFGMQLAPTLFALYRAQLDPSWKTLELLEHTGELVHRLVRLKKAGAEPPGVSCRRSGADTVQIDYASAGGMCGVVIGLTRGIAAGFGETVETRQQRCVHRGDDHCEIVVRRLS